jgi:large subunit ribosomal protein L18
MSTDKLAHKQFKAAQRRKRTRSRISGTADRPRLAVHVTNKNISVQLINDIDGTTLISATTAAQTNDGNMSDKAVWLGGEIAKKAKAANVKKVVFDRSDRQYHGRVKGLADAARSGGLEF